MCTYVTCNVAITGSAKGPAGWFSTARATVYFDHPFHAGLDHSLNIDFADPDDPSKRAAVELSPASARSLAAAILATLDTGETNLAAASSETADAAVPSATIP
jgi:hypothetical protein